MTLTASFQLSSKMSKLTDLQRCLQYNIPGTNTCRATNKRAYQLSDTKTQIAASRRTQQTLLTSRLKTSRRYMVSQLIALWSLSNQQLVGDV